MEHKLIPGAGWRAYLITEENLREYFYNIWFYSNYIVFHGFCM